MANYLPFNSIGADRACKAEDWAWYFATFISNGVFPNPSNGLQVTANGNMEIAVKPGYGFINGYAFRNVSDYIVELDMADGALNRIDRFVLRWDLTNRMMLIDVLKGSVSAEPVAPAVTRSADVWELALADVYVGKGATQITQANITDLRYNSELCGICAGMITQVDASTLTAQFDAFFEEYQVATLEQYHGYMADIQDYEATEKAQFEAWEAQQQQSVLQWTDAQQTAFYAWLQEIHDALEPEPAARLAAIAANHEERITLIEYMNTKNDFFTPTLNDAGEVILDDDGYAIIADWKYKEA